MPGRIESSAVSPRPLPSRNPSSVTVKSGDSLSKLAQRAGVSVESLVQANVARYPGLSTNLSAIQIGWKLTVPGGSTTAPARPAPSAADPATQAWQQPGNTSQTAEVGTTQRPSNFGAKLAAGGAQSIELRMKQHADGIEKTGIGRYFGDHSAWKSMSTADKQQWIKDNAKPGVTAPSAGSVKESSCIGWAMENVGAAYAAAGKPERWNEIQKIVVAKGSKGTDLAKELKKDGWQSVYWNPDAKHPSDGNAEHSFSASQVAKGKGYYDIEVDAQVTNYRPSDGQGTRQDMAGIERLREVPFFFGLAKGGVHTFVGRKGEVNEFHWSEMPNSNHAIQQTPLEKFGWNSGLIMVPPGTWPTQGGATN